MSIVPHPAEAMYRPPLLQTLSFAVISAALLCGATAALAGTAAAAGPVLSDDAPDIVTYGRRDDVMRFAAEIAQRHGLDARWVRTALRRARVSCPRSRRRY